MGERVSIMRRKKRVITAGIVLCMLTCMLAGCNEEKRQNADEEKDLPVVKIGCEDYPPYCFEDADGRPVGIDVDLAAEAFRRMGYQTEEVYIDWEERKELVDSGQIDCIWNCFSINGRENEYKWAGPYMVSRQVVAVKEDSDIRTLADLADKRVAVQSTTKPEEILRNHEDARVPQLKELIALQERELIYAFLSKGYVDAVAAHETVILQYMKDYDVNYRILDDPLLEVGLGVAFSKQDDRGLDEQLDETLRKMQQDGTMEKIIGKYLNDPERYLEDISDEQ